MPIYALPLIVAVILVAPHMPEDASWSAAGLMVIAAVMLSWGRD